MSVMPGAGSAWRWLFGVVAVVGLLAAACGDSDDGTDTGPTDGDETAESNRFVGLTTDDAAALAESEGRMWRISRDGEEFFAMDASQVEGRVTFEVDDGIVTTADIETATGPGDTDPDNGASENPVLARLQADAVIRLVTVDHNFAADTFPFDTVIVSSVIADDPSRQLEPLALELIAAGVEADAAVEFTQVPDAEIADFAASETGGIAVARIEDIRIDDDRAEIEMGLWCGNVCAVFLTYEAQLADDQWTITGTVGPIAVS
jgi:hypothetical protein